MSMWNHWDNSDKRSNNRINDKKKGLGDICVEKLFAILNSRLTFTIEEATTYTILQRIINAPSSFVSVDPTYHDLQPWLDKIFKIV